MKTDEFSLFSNTDDGETKKARLISLREAVTPILANNILPELTDHTVIHSNNLTQLVKELASPILKGKKLNDESL